MSRRALLLLVLVLASCGDSAATPTEAIVLVDAETQVRKQTAHLHLLVESRSGAGVLLDETVNPKWPLRLAIVPKDEDSRRSYLVSVEASDENGDTIATARVLSGFVPHEKRYVYVLLEDACLNVVCPSDETCHAHACIDAHVASKELGTTADKARALARNRNSILDIDAGDGSMPAESGGAGGAGGTGGRTIQPTTGSAGDTGEVGDATAGSGDEAGSGGSSGEGGSGGNRSAQGSGGSSGDGGSGGAETGSGGGSGSSGTGGSETGGSGTGGSGTGGSGTGGSGTGGSGTGGSGIGGGSGASGSGTSGGSGASGSGTSGGSGAGAGGTAGGPPLPPCTSHGSDVLVLGDGFVHYQTASLAAELTTRAIAASALASGDSFSEAASPGATLAGSSGTVAALWNGAKSVTRKAVVMDGGLEDIFANNPMCLTDGVGRASDASCQQTLTNAVNAATQLLIAMKTDGVVADVFFFGYPQLAYGGHDIVTALNAQLNDVCDNVAVPEFDCHFINTTGAFDGHPDYFAADNIHPNAGGMGGLASHIWNIMVGECVAQAASSGCCAP